MDSWRATIHGYLRELVNGWVSGISFLFTVGFLIVLSIQSLLSYSLLAQIGLPEEESLFWIVATVLVSFAVTNFQIYRRLAGTPLQLTVIEPSPNRNAGGIDFKSNPMSFDRQLAVGVQARTIVSNSRNGGTVRIEACMVPSFLTDSESKTADIELRSSNSSGAILGNPFGLSQGASMECRITATFCLDVNRLESYFGSLSQMGPITVIVSATQDELKPVRNQFTVDLGEVSSRLEKKFEQKFEQTKLGTSNLADVQQAFKRFLQGPTRT